MPKIAVLDIETTGLSPIYDLILEIGIVEIDISSGKTTIIFDSLVREPEFGEAHKDSWIFLNSDLKFEQVLNAPMLEDLNQQIQSILNQYHITAFNTSFDFGFLRARGFEIHNELPCVMKTATNVCRIPHYNNNSRFKWPKCQEAWDYLFPNIAYNEKHRATDDAEHEAQIFYQLYINGHYPSIL